MPSDQADLPKKFDITDSTTWPVAMNTEEVAQVLRLTEQTVARWIREGKVPTSRVNQTHRVSRAWLLRFIDNPTSSTLTDGPGGN